MKSGAVFLTFIDQVLQVASGKTEIYPLQEIDNGLAWKLDFLRSKDLYRTGLVKVHCIIVSWYTPQTQCQRPARRPNEQRRRSAEGAQGPDAGDRRQMA